MRRRIIYSNNGTLTDASPELNDYYYGDLSFSLDASEDYIYIGSTLPFNHFWLEVTSANTLASAISVDLWSGTNDGWVSVAQVIDATSSMGASLGKSGFVTFFPDKEERWAREDTIKPQGTEQITGLGTIKIYDLFWSRLKWSADLSANVSLSYITQLFSDDNNLGSEFPDLTRTTVKSSFQSGKTTWKEQHYLAAQIIIKDLIRRGIIFDGNQILEREDLTLPSIQKVAQIIYNAMGDDYIDQTKACEVEYNKRLDTAFVKIDTNENGREDRQEQRPSIGGLYR